MNWGILRWFDKLVSKSHNASNKNPTMHNFVTKMCIFLLQTCVGYGTLRCVICEIGRLSTYIIYMIYSPPCNCICIKFAFTASKTVGVFPALKVSFLLYMMPRINHLRIISLWYISGIIKHMYHHLFVIVVFHRTINAYLPGLVIGHRGTIKPLQLPHCQWNNSKAYG